MNRIVVIAILWGMVVVEFVGGGQALKKGGFQLGGSPTQGPTSNAINDIRIVGSDVWVATGRGLTWTGDNGETWTTTTRADGLGKGGVSALAVRDGVIWVATAFDTTTELGTFPAGGGLSYSTDDGQTWYWISQPVDPRDVTEYRPTTTHIQNLTYDIALTDSAVWIASFGGGLRRSTDFGETWEVVTVDGYPFDALGYLTHRVFAVIFDGEALWVGTAGGVHKSTDGGRTWTTFNHQNQSDGISGNFVVAIAHQRIDDKEIVWAATVEALGETEYRAVSKTEDGGLTWTVMLEGEFAHNFAVDDSTVYVATDNGLYKSLDLGKTWAAFPPIFDVETGEGIYTTEMNAVGVGSEHVLWVGSSDGLARSLDGGLSWTVFRAFRVPGVEGTPETYAYPNPFSPLRHNVMGGDGYVRFQYRTTGSTRVTVRVYDFGMNLVRTVVEEKDRFGSGDYAEVWDGRNDVGDMVANGVYFYKITLTGKNPLWGKVMVVN